MATKRPANPDFKRRKAKVGKRAPKKLNETETDFKAASINVSKQESIVKRTTSELQSTRGKSIGEFASKLQHPASAVRLSASKGLNDIVKGADTSHLAPHISTIVPLIGKCILDEDDTIRSNGIAIFRELLDVFQSESAIVFGPFAQLINAYLTLAIDSLDRSTRKDGIIAIQLVASRMPTLIEPYCWKLIPGLSRLLGDRYFQYTPSQKKLEKKDRKQEEQRQGRFRSILQALVDLLASLSADDEFDRPLTQLSPNCYSLHGRSRNGFVFKSATRKLDLSGKYKYLLDGKGQASHERAKNDSTQQKTFDDLLEMLYSSLLIFQTDMLSNRMPTADEETFLLLLSALNKFLIWIQVDDRRSLMSDSGNKKLNQLSMTVLEFFPRPGGFADSFITESNTQLCSMLYRCSTFLTNENTKEKCRRQSLRHIRRYFEFMAEGKSDESQDTISSLLPILYQMSISEDPENVRLVMEPFFEFYFPAETTEGTEIKAEIARKVCTYTVFVLSKDRINEEKVLKPKVKTRVVNSLPHYLKVWKNDFQNQSSELIDALIDETRDPRNIPESEVMQVQKGIELLFDAQDGPVFDRLDSKLQRRLITLILSLETPSKGILQGLASFCADSFMSRRNQLVAMFAISAIHQIKRSISVQDYFTFLIDSTGIISKPWDAAIEKAMSIEDKVALLGAFDEALYEASKCMLQTGASRALKLIYPLLENVVINHSDTNSIQSRGALMILSALCTGVKGDDEVLDTTLTATFKSRLSDLVDSTLEKAQKDDNITRKLIQPIQSLYWYNPELMVNTGASRHHLIRDQEFRQ